MLATWQAAKNEGLFPLPLDDKTAQHSNQSCETRRASEQHSPFALMVAPAELCRHHAS